MGRQVRWLAGGVFPCVWKKKDLPPVAGDRSRILLKKYNLFRLDFSRPFYPVVVSGSP